MLIGDVRVGDNASIWFGAVLRGDFGAILVGAGSSIQDNTTVHANEVRPTDIGENVTVGHGAVLEGCTIGREMVVGMNAVILPYAEVGERVMIAAQSVVPERAELPSRVLVAGVPAKVKKELEGMPLDWIGQAAEEYQGRCRLDTVSRESAGFKDYKVNAR